MKSIVRSFAVLFGLSLPLGALAQTNQSASTRQLPTESLAVLMPAGAGGAPAASAAERSRLYAGTVLNEKGQPLAGALVSIGPDKDQVAVTNAEGTYMLRSKAAVPMLHVSYAGYEDVELSLASPQPVTFNLAPVPDYKRQLKKQTKAAVKAYYKK
ncbi:CarboxypepD_reg-like domain-containing protein [Hymenobacter daecheongensis DSM 21074]|uniref:CarboxypepD_reg-like domain-containing protein n=1 Tax=Hymenobacter daecheongensis DSM 21074 TaxID=1121955 RepID=A0A1M6EKD3_9BACT|nr:carboxypeptidase-like regulatory domain-containing protein [Hymenobacter daecheongensis]SHI85947.1 CarboxypepD_reg-like domain-containing protein [Hymenobacter daecheongensis DSM 21074]